MFARSRWRRFEGPDGTIVYSNGRGVFVLGQDGSAALALKDELIAEVFAASA